ncbi:MAG: aldehyde dehydrogenase family protein [Chlorobiota bacterium]
MKLYKYLIKDAANTSNYKTVTSPFSGKHIAKIEIADELGIEQSLRNSVEYYDKIMKNMPAYKRAEILNNVVKQMQENHEDLSKTIALEGGKPINDARAEVTRAINTIETCANVALNIHGQQINMEKTEKGVNHIAYTIKQSLGPVLAISAFNHPVNLIAHQLGTAFAAGNTIILKPATSTPLSAHKMVNYFFNAGLDKGVISLLTVSGKDMDKVVKDDRIKFITFIGSSKVGWEIRKKAYNGVRMAFEHGGTAVCTLDKKADLEEALPKIVKSAYYHAGQVCVSTQNLFIHEDIYDLVIENLKEKVSNLVTGDPLNDSTEVGPLIENSELSRIDKWVNEAVEEGAEVIVGGNKLVNQCYQPTIIANVNRKMKIYKEEIFGPILNVIKYREIEDPINAINNNPYCFQDSIFTKDIDLALHYAKNIRTKAVMINEGTAYRVDWMPFGGTMDSGLGFGGVEHSVEDMMEEKLIMINSMYKS